MVALLKQVAAARGAVKPNVMEVVHGTTLVTNTLIERKGARTGLIVTKGTRDVLTIAREIREYERMSTTTTNAYVQPLVAEYLNRLDRRSPSPAGTAAGRMRRSIS